MKEIQLSQGLVTQVDDDMFDYLNQWKWSASKSGNVFYAARTEGKYPHRKKILMHRIVMKVPNDMGIDHKNGDGLCNLRENLRECTCSENQHNQGKRKNNTSGYKGVCWSKSKNKWGSSICYKRKQIHIGYFESSEKAALAYDNAAIKYHGEFASLNFPEKYKTGEK